MASLESPPFIMSGYAEDAGSDLFLDIYRLAFRIDGREPAAGFRVHLSADSFEYPAAMIDDVPVRTVSPLALYQLRVGISSQGSFGELDEKQQGSLRRLKDRFFPNSSSDELMPIVEPLPR